MSFRSGSQRGGSYRKSLTRLSRVPSSPIRDGIVIVVQALPVLLLCGSFVGYFYLRALLGSVGVAAADVATFSDYTLQTFYWIGNILVVLAIVGAGYAVSRKWRRGWIAMGALLLAAASAFPLTLAFFHLVRVWQDDIYRRFRSGEVTSAYTNAFFARTNELLQHVDERLRWVSVPLGGYLDLVSALLALFGTVVLLGPAVSRRDRTRRGPLAVSATAIFAIMLVFATAFGSREAERKERDAILLGANGYVSYLSRSEASSSGADRACACGATLVWSGERSSALVCSDGRTRLVTGPDNLVLSTARHDSPRKTIPMTVFERRHRAVRLCDEIEATRAFAVRPPVGRLERNSGVWSLAVRSEDRRATLAFRCRAGRLLMVSSLPLRGSDVMVYPPRLEFWALHPVDVSIPVNGRLLLRRFGPDQRRFMQLQDLGGVYGVTGDFPRMEGVRYAVLDGETYPFPRGLSFPADCPWVPTGSDSAYY